MKTLNYTHLDVALTAKTVEALQSLLADYQVFYTNLRGLHWNIQGNKFFSLHEKFEEMYDDVADQVDEIAERILMLGGVPAHNFSEYLKSATIKESGYITGERESVQHVLESFGVLIKAQRELLEIAGEADDEATVAMMGDYISGQEKLVWMLVAYLS